MTKHMSDFELAVNAAENHIFNEYILKGRTLKASPEQFETEVAEYVEYGEQVPWANYDEYYHYLLSHWVTSIGNELHEKFGCSPYEIRETIRCHWAPNCQPYIPEAKFEAVASTWRPKKLELAKPYVSRGAANIPPRDWVYGGHYLRKYVSGTVSPGGVGKSALALAEAVAMATGSDLFDGNRPITRKRVQRGRIPTNRRSGEVLGILCISNPEVFSVLLAKQ